MFRFQTQTARDASVASIRGGLRRSPPWVKSLQKRDVCAKSAFPLIATGERTSRDVSNVPTKRTSRSEQSTRTYDYCPSNLYCPASHVSRATGDSEVERIY